MSEDNVKNNDKDNDKAKDDKSAFTENDKKGSIKIEIVKYAPFINAISDSRSIARSAGLLALLVCLIFSGLLLLVITLKRMYPYSDIQTNMYGATTIRDEEKDVMYWLFNTAELWANSGIAVKKGDVLNIRASGMSNTAIHKLVKDANDNRLLSTKWISTDGVDNRENPRDNLRMKWRIVPKKPQDALVMRVVEDESDSDYDSNEGVYLIGKGREGIQIHDDGYLQFAVNDIILTDEVIYKMMHDHARMLVKKYDPDYLSHFISTYPVDYSEEAYERLRNDKTVARVYDRFNMSMENLESYSFGPYPAVDGNDAVNTWQKNEMTYYKEKGYRHAWYDDNIGSFLIVIERKH